ncbi:hypothetical protein H4R24_001134 [Coemansia sp. RSA 988]|nr:hypothetical protein H4R24_001134 [Coemansia sp. RSA 988]
MGWCENSGISSDTSVLDPQTKKIIDTACNAANKVVEAGLVDFTSARVIAAACIVIAMEMHQQRLPARSVDEWTNVWAKAPGSHVMDIRRLIEDQTDLTDLCGNIEPASSCLAK